MKILKTIFVSIFVLLVFISAGVFIFVKTFDLNRYKQPIVAAIERSLGRTVDYGKSSWELSFEKGLKAQIKDLIIKELPVFGKGNFMSAESIELGVSVKDLFFKRQLSVMNISIRSPQVTIIRLKDGRINAQSFNPASTAIPAAAPQKVPGGAPAQGLLISALVINRIQVDDARIMFIDQMADPQLSLELKKIAVIINDFTLGKPFSIAMSAAFLSDRANMSAKGKGMVNVSTQTFTLKDMVINSDLVALPLAKLRQAFAGLQNLPAFDVPEGRVEISLRQFEAGLEGIKSLSVDAELRGAKLSITNGALPAPIRVTNIIAVVKNVSLAKPFDFRLSAAYLYPEPNVTLKGTAQINVKEQALDITESEVAVDGSKISFTDLGEIFPAVKSVQQVKGKCTVTVSNLRVNSQGLQSLKGEAKLKEGAIQLKELGVPVDSLEAKCSLSESAIQCEPVSFMLGKGSISLTTTVDHYIQDQKYTINGKVKDIDLAQCLNQRQFPVKVQGIASGEVSLSGQGFDPQLAIKKLAGTGSFDIKDGRLTDINILKIILDKFTFIPDLSELVEKNVPDNIKKALLQKDTVVTSAKVVAELKDGTITLNPAHVEAEGFSYEGRGTVTLDQQAYVIDGNFILTKDLAARIAAPDTSTSFLLGPEQDIRFPVKVSGKGAAFSVTPEISAFSKQMLQQKAQQELHKALDKVFDGKKSDAPAEDSKQVPGAGPAAGDPSVAAPQKTPEAEVPSDKDKKKQETKEAIKGLIDSLLK